MSIPRSCVISPTRAPEYAHSQGTQRFAALDARLVSVIAIAARRIVRASSTVNASLSLFLTLRGTVTETASKGLLAINRSDLAHAYTACAAFTQTSFTVIGVRFGVIFSRAHVCAVSSVKGSAFGPENLASRSVNTPRHRVTVEAEGL